MARRRSTLTEEIHIGRGSWFRHRFQPFALSLSKGCSSFRRERTGLRQVQPERWMGWASVFTLRAVPPKYERDGLPVSADLRGQLRLRRAILLRQPRDAVARGLDRVDRADALARSPDVLPGLGRAAAEIHLAGVARRQVVRVEPGRGDRCAQIIAVHAGEEIAVHDVRRTALDDALLVAGRRVCLGG